MSDIRKNARRLRMLARRLALTALPGFLAATLLSLASAMSLAASYLGGI
ncbi:hypothetical protein [Roseibium sp.]